MAYGDEDKIVETSTKIKKEVEAPVEESIPEKKKKNN